MVVANPEFIHASNDLQPKTGSFSSKKRETSLPSNSSTSADEYSEMVGTGTRYLMPESHTLGARGCAGILENNKSKATMILNVARVCLRRSIQRSKCLRIASAMQVIRCLAPNVLSRPILRKTLTLQPCLNQLSLSRLLYSAWITGYAMARVFTQFMTQQNGLNSS